MKQLCEKKHKKLFLIAYENYCILVQNRLYFIEEVMLNEVFNNESQIGNKTFGAG